MLIESVKILLVRLKIVKMLSVFLFIWGCIPEISKGCVDMTNASSTYLGIAGGAIIGAIVSWWVYNRQKKTSEMQEHILCRIKDLEENHDSILKKIDAFDDKHATSLDELQDLNKKLDSVLKKYDTDTSK